MGRALADRVALVTGASRGIGLAVTRTLLVEGAKVAAVSRNSSPQLDDLADESLIHVALDLMDPDAPARAVANAVNTFGGLNILVNVAGAGPPGVTLPGEGFLETTDAQWQAISN